jgi:hypothetical protein
VGHPARTLGMCDVSAMVAFVFAMISHVCSLHAEEVQGVSAPAALARDGGVT